MAGIEDVQRAINAEMSREGWTRAQFAKRVQLDPGTLADLLDGRRTPKAPTQGKIERYFGWEPGTIAELLAGRGALPSPHGDGPPFPPGYSNIRAESAEEAAQLIAVLRAMYESATREWAQAVGELERARFKVASGEERRTSLAGEIEKLQAEYPEVVVPEGAIRAVTVVSSDLDHELRDGGSSTTAAPAESGLSDEEYTTFLRLAARHGAPLNAADPRLGEESQVEGDDEPR